MSQNRKVVLFIAQSVDGYIAREDDTLDWLFKVAGEGDNGYSQFYETVDTIVMGRRTYDWIMEHEKGENPYKGKECYVFSSAASVSNEMTFVQEDPYTFIEKVKEDDGKDIWIVGGGEMIHSFMKKKLIDEYRITLAPTILGKGIPLFKRGEYEHELVLKGMNRYNQFVELHYEVLR